jgi:hypothetical protein
MIQQLLVILLINQKSFATLINTMKTKNILFFFLIFEKLGVLCDYGLNASPASLPNIDVPNVFDIKRFMWEPN